jgi:hypothetical protein
MAKKQNTVIVRRDAVTGRIVSPEYVRQHPRTTETEHRPSKKK